MKLDQFVQLQPGLEHPDGDQESSLTELFGRSALYESRQAVVGLAQTFGLESYVGELAQPKEAGDSVGQHAQMLGRAAGGLLPTLAIAVGSRYVFGRVLAHDAATAEHALLKRTTFGLSIAESGATGFLSGSLLTPTEGAAKDDAGSFVYDRLRSGASSALSFAIMSASSSGLSKMASSELGVKLGAEKVMRIGAVNGFVSGLAGGVANVEADSLVRQGRFDYDQQHLGKSMYEMALFGGGVFGLGSAVLSRVRTARDAAPGERNVLPEASHAPDVEQKKSLPELIDSEKKQSKGAHFIEELIASGAPEKNLSAYMREGLQKLEPFFDSDLPVLKRLVELQLNDPVTWSGLLADWIKKGPEQRTALVAQLVNDGATGKELASYRLDGYLKLHEQFGAESTVFSKILDLEKSGSSALLGSLATFIEKRPQERAARVAAAVENGASAEQLETYRLEGLEKLESIYRADRPALQKLLDFETSNPKFSIRLLADFIEKDPKQRVALVERVLDGGAGKVELVPYCLEGLEKLESIYGADSPALKQLLDLEKGEPGFAIRLLADFIAKDPKQRVALVERVLDGGAGKAELVPYRLEGLEKLESIYGADSPALKQLLDLEKGKPGFSIRLLADFIEKKPEQRTALVAQVLDEGASKSALSPYRLEGREQLNASFGEGSAIMQQLLKFQAGQETDVLPQIANFIKESPADRVRFIEKHLAEKETLEYFLKLGARGPHLMHTKLLRFQELVDVIPNNSDLTAKIFSAFKGDFADSTIASFLKKDPPARSQLVEGLLSAGADGFQINGDNLVKYESISRSFPIGSDELNRVIQLQKQGLRLAPLLEQLQYKDGAHIPALKALLSSGELTAEMLNDGDAIGRALTRVTLENSIDDSARAGKVIKALQELHLDNDTLVGIADFVRDKPLTRVPLLEQEIRNAGGYLPAFDLSRLQAVEELSEQFGAGSDVMNRLFRSELRGTRLPELASFINENPSVNKLFVEPLIDDTVTGAQLNSGRLAALQEIHKQFGAQSETTKRILQLEAAGLNITELVSRFINEDVSHAKLVEKLIDQGATVGDLGYVRLNGLSRLNQALGEGATITTKARPLEAKGLSLSNLADFIAGSGGSADSPAAWTTPSATVDKAEGSAVTRAAVVERLIDDGAEPKHLDAERLKAFLSLRDRFGDGAPAMKALLTAEAERGVELSNIDRFLKDDSDNEAFLQKLIDCGLRPMSADKMTTIKDLDRFMQADEPALGRLLDILEQKNSLVGSSDLWSFLSRDPEKRGPMVLQLLKDGASERNFSSLGALYELSSMFGAHVPLEYFSSKAERLDLGALYAFIRSEPQIRIPLVEEAIKNGASAAELNQYRLSALLDLKQIFAEQPDVVARLLELESQSVKLSSVAQFLRSAPRGGAEQITQMIAEGASADKFVQEYLTARLLLEAGLGTGSARAERVLSLAVAGGTIGDINNFLHLGGLNKTSAESQRRHSLKMKPESLGPYGFADSYIKGALERFELLEDLVASGQKADRFTADRLQAIEHLRTVYSEPADGAAFLERLFALEAGGFSLEQAKTFIAFAPATNAALLKELVESGMPARNLTLTRLIDRNEMNKLSEHFPSGGDVVKHLQALNAQGLSGSRTLQYVSENPSERTPVFEQLVRDQAGVDRFRELMSLQVLPARVAYALTESAARGGMPVSAVVSNLKDWKCGRHFRKMLIEEVDAGRDLSRTAIEKVLENAVAASETESRSGATAAISPLPTLSKAQRANVSEEILSMADILLDAADRINEKIRAGQQIVLLGRDMGPLLPVLKAQGRSVQYFLWSRLQDLAKTAPHWLKEVPPHAAVIDSGFAGRIIGLAKKADPTVDGFLLSASGPSRYVQLLNRGDHHDVVEKIEGAMKLTGRTKHLAPNGNAVVEKPNSESAQSRLRAPAGTDRWRLERENRELFRVLGLSTWDAWRYSQYTGLTARERLGLNSEAEVQAHYEKISKLRSAGTF